MASERANRRNLSLRPDVHPLVFSQKWVFFAVLLFTGMNSVSSALSAESDCDGWKLEQWSRETGRLDVYIQKSAVHLSVPKSGLSLLACAPWKEASIYCSKTGKIFTSSLPKFRNPYIGTLALFDGGTLADVKIVPKGAAKIKDISCQLYAETPGFSQRQMDKFKAGQVAPRAALHLEYVVTDQLKVDPQIGQIMSKFYALPTTSSVPLQFKFTSVKQEKSEQLLTYSCTKKKIKRSEFGLPAGLKPVNDGMKILTPDNAADGLDLMMMGTKVK